MLDEVHGVSHANIIGINFKENQKSTAMRTDSVSIWNLEHTMWKNNIFQLIQVFYLNFLTCLRHVSGYYQVIFNTSKQFLFKSLQ